MKKVFLLLFVVMTTLSLSAQKFGVKAGFNYSNFYGKDVEDSNLKALPGFQIGGLYEQALGGNFYLQPELLLSMKGTQADEDETNFKFHPSYIEVPVKCMYKINAGTGKLTLAVGPYVGLGLFGKYTVSSDDDSKKINIFTKTEIAGIEIEPVLKRFDAGLSSAIGYELASGLFFNVESSLGLINIVDKEDAKTKNSVFSLAVGFKF